MSIDPDLIRVLAVDDHALLREGIAALVNAEPDMRVIAEAIHGEQAIENFRIHRPDVTLMDLQMPGMDGFDALEALKTNPVTREIPVIALSADAMPHQVAKGQQVGFEAYLTKPLDILKFQAVLEDLLTI